MTFDLKFTFCIDIKADDSSDSLSGITDELSEFVSKESYGNGISMIGIHLICVNAPSGYEIFFKVKKPEYFSKFKYTKPSEGEITIDGYFSYEVRISQNSYKQILKGDDKEIMRILKKELLSSLDNLRKIPKEVKDFDKDKFRLKVEEYFASVQ